MKKLSIFFITILIVFPVITDAANFMEWRFPTQTYPSGATMVLDRLRGIMIIKPQTRIWHFEPTGSSAQYLGSGQGMGDIVMNGSYFGYSEGTYVPAGHMAYDQAPVDPTHCLQDQNLCAYILLDSMQIVEGLTITTEPTITAGPILIREGKLNEEITRRYSHRQHRTTRTILVNSGKGVFFVITKKQYTLPKISAYILKAFGNNVTAVNLDGGSSSSLRTRYPLFQIYPRKILPSFFLLR